MGRKRWEKIVSVKSARAGEALPDAPGVYFFLGENKEILYIGKATTLRDRVRSYFSSDLLAARGPKLILMRDTARHVAYRRTDSVLEALLLESRLIKEHQPPHNTDAKDDKSHNHVVITKERFPRVLLVRGRDLSQGKFREPIRSLYGPFPNGLQLREALKIIRTLFSFRDRCIPESGRACFHREIGLCPGVCDGSVSARTYGTTIRAIEQLFAGKKDIIVRRLEREMKRAAKDLCFEEAGAIKRTIFGLRHIQDIALLKDDMKKIEPVRIEGYDVAHLAGQASVGVMTVVSRGLVDKEEYREFRLRGTHNGDDLAALTEILSRRLKHPEWRFPEVIVVDGGALQVRAAKEALLAAGVRIPIVGVVKDKRHQPERLIGDERAARRFESDILLANSEAHRFAIRLHRKRRGKEFLIGRQDYNLDKKE